MPVGDSPCSLKGRARARARLVSHNVARKLIDRSRLRPKAGAAVIAQRVRGAPPPSPSPAPRLPLVTTGRSHPPVRPHISSRLPRIIGMALGTGCLGDSSGPQQHSVLDLVCSPCYHVGLLCERPPEPLRVRDRRRPDRRDSEVQPVRPVPGHLLAFTRHPLCPGLSGPCRTPLPAAAVFPHLRPPGRSGGGDRGGDWGGWWWVAAPGEPPRPRLRSWHEQMPATTCKRLALTVAAPTDHD